MKTRLVWTAALAALNLFGCMRLHHVQLGDIDQTGDYTLRPFDIKVSETGVSIDQARAVAGQFAGQQDRENMGQIATILALIQMGPRTGKNVYSETYADNLDKLLRQECPSGRITGLMAIRETRDYPVISGEIVKVTGYCQVRR